MTRVKVSERSTRHVENCIGIVRVLLQSLQGPDRRKNKELDLASCCLPLQFFHYRQSSVHTGAHHKTVALPWDVLFAETGLCPKSSVNFLEGFLQRLRILPRSMTTS